MNDGFGISLPPRKLYIAAPPPNVKQDKPW